MSDVRVSVIIPTKDRWASLERMLTALSMQTAVGEFEVLVVDDGSDESPPAVVRDGDWPIPVRLLQPGRVGIGQAKNHAIAESRGDLLLFVNDDTYPTKDFVGQHIAAREDAGDRLWMHLGLARWRDWPDANLFDVLIAETGMIFFYHNLEPRGLYNFRHAWNCNLSIDAQAVKDVGGFNEALGPFFFEDLELAYRLEGQGWQVRYWPWAECEHDHRYEPAGYIRREHLLGRMAVWLWRANPECFMAVYGRPLDNGTLAYYQRFVDEHGREADAFASQFVQWHSWSPRVLDQTGGRRGELLDVFVQSHRLMKRVTFRRGLLEEWSALAAGEGGVV